MGLLACAGFGTGCGRIGFGSSPDGVIDLDAGNELDSGTAGDPCLPAADLGASGCLTGAGPIALWRFDRATALPIPDVSGRAPCVPLQASGPVEFTGAAVTLAGGAELFADATSAGELVQAIASAGQVTVEIFVATATPQTAPIFEIADDIMRRVGIDQLEPGSHGEFEGAGVNVGTNIATDTGRYMFLRHDGANLFYSAGLGAGYAFSGSYTWNAANASMVFGPWDGRLLRAAIYDRGLSDAERSCLSAAGANVTP